MQKKILVVEDDPVTVAWLTSLLERDGHQVESVTRGQPVVERLATADLDLVIMDLALPDTDGIEVIRRIRQTNKKVVVLILSMRDRPEDVIAGLRAGADDYIAKRPGADMELLAKVHGLARRAEPEEPTAFPTPVPTGRRGKIIAFFSAKGGTGTSSVCLNLTCATALLRPQARILLADMVFPLGTIARMIGLQTPETLAKLTHAGHGRYDAALVNKYISPRQRWGWRVLTSASGLDEAQALEVGEIAAIFETLGTMFDYLFVDLGRSLSRITLPIMQCAAIIAVILTPDINTVALTKTSLEYLFSVGITPLQLVLINNRTIGRVWISKEEIEKELSLPLLGTIPFEAELFTMAINAHVPFVAKYPEGAASMMFTELANQLLARAGQ